MRSAFLEGLVREPSSSLRQQVQAWDESDVLIQFLEKLVKTGERLAPTEWATHLRRFGASLVAGQEAEHVGRFTESLDPALMKLCRVLEHRGIAIAEEPSVSLLCDLALEAEGGTVEILRRTEAQGLVSRVFSGAPRPGFQGATIEEAAAYTVKKLFDQLSESFDALPEPDRRKAAAEILEAVERLDPKTQAEIRRKLDIEKLSAEAFMRAGAIAAIGSTLGLVVAVGGFGSYALLTSTIAAMAGLVGLTLPFSAYILATSALAFVTNPATIGIGMLGGGWFLRHRANRSIRDRYLTVFMALSVIARSERSHADPVDAFARHARRRYAEFLAADGAERNLYAAAFPAFRRPSRR